MKLSEFAKECRDTWKEDRSGVPVVGLEHLEPGEVKLSAWDVDSENTFTKRFNKGQVLLGRRRVYLRKAVVAPFDGICSGDITVIEAIPGKILPELLPFVIQNDAFFDYAEQGSAGSLSPRVKWEHLKDFEVNLPSIDDQKALAEKLWAAYRLKESYKKLLAATDEMVKSRFIEMFGDPSVNNLGLKTKKLSQLGSVDRGVSKARPRNSPDLLGGPYPLIQTGEIASAKHYITNFEQTYSEKGLAQSKMWPKGTLCITIAANIADTAILDIEACFPDSVVGFISNGDVETMFMHYWFMFLQSTLERQAPQTAQKNINLEILRNLDVIVPSMDEQASFVRIVEQADKSGFELRKSIESIDTVIKSLINN